MDTFISFFFNTTLAKILIISTLIIGIWMYKSFSYWKRRGLVLPSSPTFLLGHSGGLFLQTKDCVGFILHIYKRLRSNMHGGIYIFWIPMYVPIDPMLCKHILQEDFHHFTDRGMCLNEKQSLLGANLLFIEGVKWRSLRTKLTPAFTLGKIKLMLGNVLHCANELKHRMDLGLESTAQHPVEIKEVLMRFTIDVIGSCVLGIECNSLRNPDDELFEIGKRYINISAYDTVISFLNYIMPNVMKCFGVREAKSEIAKSFLQIINAIVECREKNNVSRKDFIDLLLQMKTKEKSMNDTSIVNGNSSKDTFDIKKIAAQVYSFFLAGFETSSTAMTFCLYELTLHLDIQERLREEINQVLDLHNGVLTYEAIMAMTFMDQVIYETLRKYPSVPVLFRECTKNYRVPNTDVVIEKGTKVLIPIIGLHRDERYFPDPEKFDPDRFSVENKSKINPNTFLPFGEGPRICIGLRFGIMQMKVGLYFLIKNYKFTLSTKTKLPLELDASIIFMGAKGGIWLNYTKAE